MKIPERVFERLKEIVRRGDAALSRRSLKTRPFAHEDRKRGETPLRMVQRTRAAEVPGFGWQDQSLQIIAVRPPAVPQLAHIFTRRFFVDVEVGRLQETRCAKEQRLAILNVFAQQPQGQTLCEKCERQLVFLVTERGRDLLEKRFVASVHVDLVTNAIRFLSQTKLRSGIEHAADAFLRQILQRRLTPPGPCEWDVCVKRLW